MSQIIDVRLGPFRFSEYNPQVIAGPNREAYVVTHQIPGRDGGIVEYLGLRPKEYSLRGFLAPTQIITDPSASILSGVALVDLTTDNAKDALFGLQGSGALLLKFESTYSNYSGFPVVFENDFFFIKSLNFGFEAGKTYPYYPYSLGLQRATPRTFGASGASDWSPSNLYFSGYIHSYLFRVENQTSGETINSLGFYASSVASGNAKMAIYDITGGGGTKKAETASQAVHSGWNWFPLNPSFASDPTVRYTICIKSDVASIGGWTIRMNDASVYPAVSGCESYQSGVTYGPAFPSTFVPGTFANVSGSALALVMVGA